jgi:butyrate kinase
MPFAILVLNPGSTSTKLAIFDDDALRDSTVLRHDPEALRAYPAIWDQFPFRLEAARAWAKPPRLDAVVGMGGLFRPLKGGTYRVNEAMLADARGNKQGEHASNLGCAMAEALARDYNCPPFVVDPVSVDEMEPLARYSGHPLITRSALSHALNLHAAGRQGAAALGLPLASSNFVIAHLGGGISVAPVRGGKIIDVNDASADGPFSPERTGGLPLQQFITLAFSGTYNERELRSLVRGKGGLTAYLGTNSALEVEKRIAAGDADARAVYEAMAYQIAKEIGAMATVLAGGLHAVILTGGLASSAMLTGMIADRVRFLGPIILYPGEDEMRSLAEGALCVLRGETAPETY